MSTAPLSSPILSVDDLEIAFGSEGSAVIAVDGISYDLYAGETLAIVGESGSGKSVSSLALMGLLPIPPAQIRGGKAVFGEAGDLLDMTEDQLRSYRGDEIAIVFQEPLTSLNPAHRCGRQVAEALTTHTDLSKEEIYDRVFKLFAAVKLPDPERAFRSYPHELSGGQLQRVMISMAISCNPRVLICDEPTTALDVTVQRTILHLLTELNQANEQAMIFITHDLGVVQEIADKVLVMHQGKVVERGKVEEVFANPVDPYTKGLLACRPPLTERYRRLPVVSDFTSRPADDHDHYIASLKEPMTDYRQRLENISAARVVLSVQDIHKHYTNRQGIFGGARSVVRAVDGVSFDLRAGESLGLVGESGCGKSTLAKVIMRLIEPTSGGILYEGRDLTKLRGSALRKIRKEYQIIFQDPYSSLNPRHTIGHAITEPMQVHGLYGSSQQRTAKAIELLEKVGLLPDHFDRYPHQFSGGQRQRICIARSIGLSPKFLLCDESVSALDVSVQAQVLNLLKDLKSEYDFSTLFISHDLSVVKFFCDNVLVMSQGRIVERGPVEDVISSPAEEYTRRLIEAIPGYES